MADLSRISVGGGFFSEIAAATMPNFPPDQDSIMAVEAPSVLVWVMDTMPVVDGNNRIGGLRRTMEIWIYGVVKQERAVQQALIRLYEDVRAVMLFNPQRNYPGLSQPNTWGYTTEEVSCSFAVDEGQQSSSAGLFKSIWRVSYEYERPS